MPPDADATFADLLLLRCPERREEILGMLPEARRRVLSEFLERGSTATKTELAARIAERFASASTERRRQLAQSVGGAIFERLPPVLQRRLAWSR